ncbi:MAG: beta-lactamase family protein [Gammaproteobacteria bacterium]|nr:beta-lactamase family protein [Gammaproteobacteria bacterium]
MINEKFIADTPESVGIDSAKLAVLLDRCRKEVDDGLLPSAQVCIARNGRIAAFETFGNQSNNSLYCVFSATKGITSAAAWLLIQEGKLDITLKVTELVPEFSGNGKEAITVEQLFTHTAGFPHAPFRPTDWWDKEKRYKRFSDWTLNWPPGSRFEYHPTSSMWVIADIIERLSGLSYESFVRERIARPLGLPDLWVGCPESEHHRIAPVVHVGETLTPEDYKEMGLPVPPVTEVTEEALSRFNETAVRKVPVPGGGGIMSAAELALFYQALLHGGLANTHLWTPETLSKGRQLHTGDMINPLTQAAVSRGLGIVLAGDNERNLRGFGHTNSPTAFGHNGAGGQLAWVDPETGISLGYCTNGFDRNDVRQARRGVSIGNKAADCALV